MINPNLPIQSHSEQSMTPGQGGIQNDNQFLQKSFAFGFIKKLINKFNHSNL